MTLAIFRYGDREPFSIQTTEGNVITFPFKPVEEATGLCAHTEYPMYL